MWRRQLRRVDVAASWQRAREQFAAIATERDQLRQDLARVRLARDQAIDLVHELQAAIMERNRADLDLHHLRREREIHRASLAVRDPAQPLN
jgi:hypothetical protein